MNLLCQLWSLNETIQVFIEILCYFVLFSEFSSTSHRSLRAFPEFPKLQEFKAQQSRHSSLSPHGWLDPEEEQELDSEGSDEEEFYNQQYGHPMDGSDIKLEDPHHIILVNAMKM